MRPNTQPKTRSWGAVAAHLRGGAGAHGGRTKKERRKRERSDTKQSIKKGDW